jgi:signal peptidase II
VRPRARWARPWTGRAGGGAARGSIPESEVLRAKLAIFGVILPLVLVLDLITKRWALEALAGGRRIDLFGGLLPLTLAFNRGAAFGIRIGEDSRWFFVPITIVALVLLGMLLVQARKDDLLRVVSLSLVVAGAIGNLYDRVRWSRGVVDFLGPVDLGFANFPIFNVADIAITCGAGLLALSFWLEEREERRAAQAAGPPPPREYRGV